MGYVVAVAVSTHQSVEGWEVQCCVALQECLDREAAAEVGGSRQLGAAHSRWEASGWLVSVAAEEDGGGL